MRQRVGPWEHFRRGNAATTLIVALQAPVSLIGERPECIEAGLDGGLVDHPPRLDVPSPDSLR